MCVHSTQSLPLCAHSSVFVVRLAGSDNGFGTRQVTAQQSGSAGVACYLSTRCPAETAKGSWWHSGWGYEQPATMERNLRSVPSAFTVSVRHRCLVLLVVYCTSGGKTAAFNINAVIFVCVCVSILLGSYSITNVLPSAPDITQFKQGVKSVAGKLSVLANGVMTSIQVSKTTIIY